MHPGKDCSVRNAKCYKCSKSGHIKSQCRTKPRKNSQEKKFIHSFAAEELVTETKRKRRNLKLNNAGVKMLYDTDIDISIISKNIWKGIGNSLLKKSSKVSDEFFFLEMICNVLLHVKLKLL